MILLAAFFSYNVIRDPLSELVPAARIEKTAGAVYVLSARSELHDATGIPTIDVGQTIVTGRDSLVAVALSAGGSLRIDSGTRVRFAAESAIFLESGRIYFDSVAAGIGGRGSHVSDFVVHTDHGEIRHVGTQFMAHAMQESLVVSVREGEVEVDGRFYDDIASPGEQLTFVGDRRPIRLSIAGHGGDWSWVEATTPVADVDGKSLHEFLIWVSRELGLGLQFEGGAEEVAQNAILRGTVDSSPADALRMRLASAALEWRIDEGVVYVGSDL